jgi:eukaryotic-like serine/threonine-protein kinase
VCSQSTIAGPKNGLKVHKMSLGRFLISRIFFKQVLIAFIIVIVLVFMAWQGLAIYTRHGKHLSVPDFSGLTLSDIDKYRIGQDFEFVVLDSVYDNSLPKGSIVVQDPQPNSLVKEGRKIYLTTVAILPEKVQIPDLVDLTFRQAVSSLETHGLLVGKLEYIPDIAQNAVLQQLFEGEVIAPGTFVLKGSQIDLVLGQGLGNERISVPFLLGLTQAEAHQIIRESHLNTGANIFESGADSNARVYKQNPPWKADAYLKMGQQLDLWYRAEHEFNFDSLLHIYLPDTLLYNDSIYFDSTF